MQSLLGHNSVVTQHIDHTLNILFANKNEISQKTLRGHKVPVNVAGIPLEAVAGGDRRAKEIVDKILTKYESEGVPLNKMETIKSQVLDAVNGAKQVKSFERMLV